MNAAIRGSSSHAPLPEPGPSPVVVTVTDTCRAAILRNTAAAADGRETGGILLGHHR